MPRISIESCKMGVYPSYFVDYSMIQLCHGYSVKLRGYDVWENISLFSSDSNRCTVPSTLRPELLSVETNFTICIILSACSMINKNICIIGEHGYCHQGVIATRRWYYPVRMYNKDKNDK